MQSKDAEIAKKNWEKAVKINPQDKHAWNNLGLACDGLGDYQKATKCYEKAIEIDPHDEAIWYNLAVAYDNLDDYQKAIACWEKAIEIDPQDLESWGNLGGIYKDLGNYQQAAACWEKVVEIDPQDGETWGCLGIAYDNLGNHQKAIACYEKALEIDPQDGTSWYNLGGAHADLGNYQKAIACYEKAVVIDPLDKEAQKRLKQIKNKHPHLIAFAEAPNLLKIMKDPNEKMDEKIQFIKKLALIYDEISLEKMILKTGLRPEKLEQLLEELFLKGEITGKIKGNIITFESQKSVIDKEIKQSIKDIEVKREYDYVGGLIRFKVLIINNSGASIDNIDVQLRMPEHLRLIRIVPVLYRKGDKAFIPNMQQKQSQSIDFYIEPLICGSIPIEVLVVYQDSVGTSHSLIREAKSVVTKCPPIINPGEANIARVKNLMQTVLNAKQFKTWQLQKTPERVFELLQEAIQSWAGKSVTQPIIQGDPTFRGEVYYFILSKVPDSELNNLQEQIVVHIEVDTERIIAQITVACEKPATSCGVLAHVWELCEQRMAEAFGLHLRALWCPECGAPLSKLPKIGEKLTCMVCRTPFQLEVLTG